LFRGLRNLFNDPIVRRQLEVLIEQEVREALDGLWFDGCALSSVRDAIEGRLPQP